MRPESTKLLYDVITAMEEVASFLRGRHRDDFLQDRLLRGGG
jgi:uncharacterized protein with HEPN domain